MKLTKTEKEMLKEFFEECGNRLGGQTCNDYYIPNTPANRAFAKKVMRSSYSKKDLAEELEAFHDQYENGKAKEICLYNWMVFGYLIDKVKKIIGME